jgi:hypothetical protein
MEGPLELTATEDQDPVEALAPQGADEALRVCVGLWCPHRGSDDRDLLASKDLVEPIGELCVAVVDQKPKRRRLSPSDQARLRACWVAHTLLGLSLRPASSTRRLWSSMKKST